MSLTHSSAAHASGTRQGCLSAAVDARDRWFRTPLQWAVRSVSLFKNHHATASTTAKHEPFSSSHFQPQVINGHVSMVALLVPFHPSEQAAVRVLCLIRLFQIRAGANVNWCITGRTINKKGTHARLDPPLHLAARRGGPAGLEVMLVCVCFSCSFLCLTSVHDFSAGA
jgi:hypothetical protein